MIADEVIEEDRSPLSITTATVSCATEGKLRNSKVVIYTILELFSKEMVTQQFIHFHPNECEGNSSNKEVSGTFAFSLVCGLNIRWVDIVCSELIHKSI